MKLSRAVGAVVVLAVAGGGLVAQGAEARPHRTGVPFATMKEFVAENGVAAVQDLNPDLSVSDISALSQDQTARITPSGKILYLENKVAASSIGSSAGAANVMSKALDDFLSLNSRPTSRRTIYLDFDGHTVPEGTQWDAPPPIGTGGNPMVAGDYPAFSIDDSPEFNATEKQAIINTWAAVAEDYAMFDVNVTTNFPGEDALTRSSQSDLVFGTRVLVSAGTATWNSSRSSCNCGGIAYLGVFDESIDSPWGSHYSTSHDDWQPAFAFISANQLVGQPSSVIGKFISDVASHEAGHNLGLQHDGSFHDSNRDGIFVDENQDGVDDITGDNWSEYFIGLTDSKNWAPIMGAGYYNGVVQWSNGDYGTPANPATDTENDISTIAETGVDLLPDEPNNTFSTATPISTSPVSGVISTRTDADIFRVTVTNSRLGIHSYSPTVDTNLDTKLTLYDSKRKAIFSTDALSDMFVSRVSDLGLVGQHPVSGMDGVLNADLPNGTYYIRVEGVGRSGAYSDYGSVGAYSIQTRTPSVSSIPTTSKPTISGVRRKGYTLTAKYGTWSSGVTFKKQWLRDGVVISGANSKSYTLTRSDVGHKISFRLIGSKTNKRTAIKVSSKTTTITR